MKEDIFKMVGVKNAKEFYSKFSNDAKGEAAFMAKYGKQVKKLVYGNSIKKAQGGFTSSPSPAPLQMETYDFDKNQKAINKAANKISRQNLRQGVGIESDEGVMDESIQGNNPFQNMSDSLQKLDSEKLEAGFQTASAAGGVVTGITNAIDEKRKQKSLKAILPVVKEASRTRPEQIQRRYLRDVIMPNESYERGTEILSAKNGGEITNTFAPNTIYKDLKKGGKIKTANAGAVIEGIKTTGDIAASIAGAGTRKLAKQNQEMLGQIGFQSGMQGIQNSQYVSHMEDGGNMNPQLIKQFGDYTMNQLLQPDPMMNTLRSGGNLREYTPPSDRALRTYEEGGELKTSALNGNIKTLWGGGVKELSNNRYMPYTGSTVGFIGNDHNTSDKNGNTGIGVQYGQGDENSSMASAKNGAEKQNSNIVEVQKEPAVELRDPETGQPQLTVFGAMKPSENIKNMVGYSGKKNSYQNIVFDLTKKEQKLNKFIDKSTKGINETSFDTIFDKLALNSYEANIKGANTDLAKIADMKQKLADAQSATLDTAKQFGLVAQDLSEGKIKIDKTANDQQARFGKNITKAQFGETVSDEDYTKAMQLYDQGKIKEFQQLGMKLAPDYVKSLGVPTISKRFDDGIDKQKTQALLQELKRIKREPSAAPSDFKIDLPELPNYGTVENAANTALDYFKTKNEKPFEENYPEVAPRNKNWMMNAMNQVLPYLRPSDIEQLDPNQLTGEMLALATNQLEPVQAQTFQPQLGTPYDISYQDQLNANQSDYRALQRMTGYNPAAQAMLNAQKYSANQQVLGEQFRANQAMKDRVYGENRQMLNEANLKNLAIYDQQYERQASALANTKATAQAALSSIASKYAQNQLQNRTLQTYENLYNFRYGPNGRAVSVNPLVQFDTQMAGSTPNDIEKLIKLQLGEQEAAKIAKEDSKKSNTRSTSTRAAMGALVRDYKNL